MRLTPHKTASLPIRSGRRLCNRCQQYEKKEKAENI